MDNSREESIRPGPSPVRQKLQQDRREAPEKDSRTVPQLLPELQTKAESDGLRARVRAENREHILVTATKHSTATQMNSASGNGFKLSNFLCR